MNVLAVDLDGTLRDKHLSPIPAAVQRVNELFEHPENFIVIHTARSYSMFESTRQWLLSHHVKHHSIVMEKVRATRYYDDRNSEL